MAEPLSPNTSLGHYSIISKIGAGGMGEVYLAQDTKLDRKVALKILPADVGSNFQRMNRFVREAKSTAALNHPNILTVYEIDEFEGRHYIATELIDGQTLREHLSHEKHLPLKTLLQIGIQVAEALFAAHQAGIIHRDIKPENIMLRHDGIVKVLDFGLAKLIEGSNSVDTEAQTRGVIKTEPGVVVGTAIYMSPEQARGVQVDGRTDIFSLAVVIYEMVAGRRPFEGATSTEIFAAILSDKAPAPLARYSSEVPPELERIVEKAIRKDRDERYQTVKDLLVDLRGLKNKLEVDAEIARTTPPAHLAKSLAHTTQVGTGASSQAISGSLSSIASGNRTLAVILIVLLVIAVAGLGYYAYSIRRVNHAVIDSIAVLPLVNTATDPNTEYLSDGISDALINSLTELRQLHVVARSTAFRYKGKEIDPQQVGHDLSVRAVLTGRVRQMGDKLDVQVDLVDATTGAQLWGEEYERNISDVLTIKQTIAREVTEKLRLRLFGAEQQKLVRHDTTNAEAYQFYLRGRYFWNHRTADNLKRAIEQFQQAIDRDPNFALGYVGLADCYGLLEELAGIPSSETLAKARAAADRALQLDDSLAEGHTSSAFVFQQMWRWQEAQREFERAISLNPNYPTAHHWFSIYLRSQGQFEDSLKEIKQAHELDPLSSVISQNIAELEILKNDLNSAVAQCKEIIELDPDFPGAHDELGFAYLKQGRFEDAIAEFHKTVDLSGRASRYLGDLGYGEAVSGNRAEALAIEKDLEEKYARHEAVGQYVADVYAGLGDTDKAFEWLKKDLERGSGNRLMFVRWWFTFEKLRKDPRYLELVHRMGLQV